MKKIGLLAVIMGYCLIAFAQKTTFTINGTINWRNQGNIYLSYQDKDGKFKTDSSLITNQTFKFKGEINEPKNVYISNSLKSKSMDDPNFASFFIEPNEMKLELTEGDYKNFKLKGSKTQDEFNQLEKQKAAINAELKPYYEAYRIANDEYIKAIKAKLPQDQLDVLHEKTNSIRDKFEPFNKRMDQIDYAFILKNPNSYVSAYLMIYKLSDLSLDSAQLIYKSFSPLVKASSYGKTVNEEIGKLRKGSPGATATVFTAADIDGKQLSLADFKGKYVLLDFWASWCIPCRKGNPHLKKLYAQYKSKGLEIIGISDDDSKPEAWKNAVAQDGIGVWKHVLRGLKRTKEGFDRTNDINENFGIHTLPTKILINKEGKIIGRYGGGGESDEAMDKKLETIFGKLAG